MFEKKRTYARCLLKGLQIEKPLLMEGGEHRLCNGQRLRQQEGEGACQGDGAYAGYWSAGKSCLRTILPYYTWPAPLSCGEASSGIGSKHDGKQNYLCRDCYRQFVDDHNLTYPGCHSGIDQTILKMRVHNCGIRDISEITGRSRDKVQKALKISQHHVISEKAAYE